jgi:hypothetical protein
VIVQSRPTSNASARHPQAGLEQRVGLRLGKALGFSLFVSVHSRLLLGMMAAAPRLDGIGTLKRRPQRQTCTSCSKRPDLVAKANKIVADYYGEVLPDARRSAA